MSTLKNYSVLTKLAGLQTELVEQAYALECQGRLDAAEVAIETAGRLGEFCAQIESAVVRDDRAR